MTRNVWVKRTLYVLRWVFPIVLIVIVGMRLSELGWAEMWAARPGHIGFYLLLVAQFFIQPFGDFLVYRNLWGAANRPPLPVILLLCAVVGLVYGPIAPIYNYVMQTRAPQHLRGRVVGVMGSLAYAAGPLGLIVAGPLADAAGLHATFLALSLPMLVLGLVAVFLPALRELDRPPEECSGVGG